MIGAQKTFTLLGRLLLLGLCTTSGQLLAQTQVQTQTPPEQRPNIVLIMLDDFGYECVTANGGESYQTPNFDRLAATGLRFEHCYSQPLCTPSRVQIMTGRYNSRNYEKFGLLPEGAYTFGHLLRTAGYRTGVIGKWQLGGGPTGPDNAGFDEYRLWQLTNVGNRYPNPELETNGVKLQSTQGEYGPDLVCDYGCEFIERLAKTEQPFFLYYPMILTHSPFEPTPGSPEYDPRARLGDLRETRRIAAEDPKYFAAMVEHADRLIGRIVDTLEAQGVRENTLILVTGDNGTDVKITSQFRGQPYQGGKGTMTNRGTHVPLIASWPGTVPQGQVNRDLIDFSDFLPTLAAVAQAEIPASLQLDGQSFWPQLQGQIGNPREWIYCWFFRNGVPETPNPPLQFGESARTQRYKLYLDGKFYDLESDPFEQSPLAQAQTPQALPSQVPQGGEHSNTSRLTAEQQQVRQKLQAVLDAHTRAGFYETAKNQGE